MWVRLSHPFSLHRPDASQIEARLLIVEDDDLDKPDWQFRVDLEDEEDEVRYIEAFPEDDTSSTASSRCLHSRLFLSPLPPLSFVTQVVL